MRLAESNRALVYDPLRNFEPGVICYDQTEILRYLERNAGGHFRVIYRPKIDITNRRESQDRVNWVCKLARAVAPVDVYLDELDHFSSGEDIPEQVDGLVRYGRNISISLRGAARRPQVVIPRHWMTETTRFSIFRCVDPRDVSYISQYTSIDPERILSLAPLECLEWLEGEVSKFRLTYTPAGPKLQAGD